MKLDFQKIGLISFLLLIIILFLLSLFYYPRSRDEFYYLDTNNFHPFKEYFNSYFEVNARIGQFFSNLLGRNIFYKLIIGTLIFIVFFIVSFVVIFRRIPEYDVKSLKGFIVISAVFIFLINYFGEMFIYVPFSTNYTLLNIFYLIYIYFAISYFIYQKDYLEKFKIPYWFIIVFGIFTGMGNEHCPPVLIAFTGLGLLSLIIREKKILLPKRFTLGYTSVMIGYIFLLIAPANKVRFEREGKEAFELDFADYFINLKKTAHILFHYNLELLLIFPVAFFIFLLLLFKKRIEKKLSYEIFSYWFLAALGVIIAAYSPIIATRLLFFSLVLVIISLLVIFFRSSNIIFQRSLFFNVFTCMSGVFLLFYFICTLLITRNAYNNYNEVVSQIETISKKSPEVILKKSFDYKTDFFGKMNRKVLLDLGEDYIDQDEKNNTTVEQNIINYYKIKILKVEK
ncbi:DUF6056 family protein [Chryseobacterium binzhouense]|uniref:DUF6056 family protein n=1 Tax=Chryseobacterium binzhouense TaxID=2593646 RepID=UPI0028A0522B|nr:DUF6056 family protein [Chryseobacterium binzhouense]